jgi:hypothetical protein
MTNEIMNDAEKAELEKLNENPVLISALKKVFLADIYQNGTLSKELMNNEYTRNFAFSLQFDPNTGNEYARSNEDLGKALRACNEALRIINFSFQRIDKYKKIIEIDVSQPAKHR